jgi:hypothetical protein
MENDALSALDAAQAAFDKAQGLAGASQPWSGDLVQFLSISILTFSCVTLLLITALLWRKDTPAMQILRIFGIIAIIGVSSVLLITGYSNDQLTPIVGLFGAIAGYLLGKDPTGPADADRQHDGK